MTTLDVKARYASATRTAQKRLSKQAGNAPTGTPEGAREERVFAKFAARARDDYQTLIKKKKSGV